MFGDAPEPAGGGEPADRSDPDLVIAVGVREIEAADRLFCFGAALAVVAAPKRFVPESGQREAQPARTPRQQEDEASHHDQDRAGDAGDEITPCLVVATGEQPGRLGEAGEDVGLQGAEGGPALECAPVDHAVLGAQRAAFEFALEIKHIGRGQAIDPGVEATAIGAAVVVDYEPEIEHSFVRGLAQARAIEEHAGDGVPVMGRELTRQPVDARPDGQGELCGDDRFEAFELLAHARTKCTTRSAESAMLRSGSGCQSSPSTVKPQLMRSSAWSTLRLV